MRIVHGSTQRSSSQFKQIESKKAARRRRLFHFQERERGTTNAHSQNIRSSANVQSKCCISHGGVAMTAAELVEQVKITEVWALLGGGKIIRNRARAFWRGGDGLSVSVHAGRNAWYDHRDNVGGGVLDLIATVRQCGKAEAAAWLAGQTGASLDGLRADPQEKREYAQFMRDLPKAKLWRRAYIDLTKEILARVKAALFDPTEPRPGVGEVRYFEDLLREVRALADRALVDRFRSEWTLAPRTTEALIDIARHRETAQRQALAQFMAEIDRSERRAA